VESARDQIVSAILEALPTVANQGGA
jgi:hypothetical protein